MRRLTLLLLYGDCTDVVFFRRIERVCSEDLASWLRQAGLRPGRRVLAGNQQPDHSRIRELSIDGDHQVIVAMGVSNQPADVEHLMPP